MITLEPRAPWPWPYAVFPFYVQGLQPPVDPRFRVVNGLSAAAPRHWLTVPVTVRVI